MMSGFDVAPVVWIDAGKGVTEAADDLERGVDAFCRAVGGQPFGSDDLGRALFEGDPRSGAPGFARLRDGLLSDLAATVNLLRGMGAGLVDTGDRYIEADGTIVDELGAQRRPMLPTRTPAGLREYRLPQVLGGLPSTAPPPDLARQALWIFETVGLGFPWPDGDLSGVEALRDAATAVGAVLEYVAEGIAGHAGRVTGSGFGDATEAFGSAAREVHGAGGLLEDLKRRCEQLAAYCQSGINAIVKARWHCVATAVFVLTLICAASVFGPMLEAAVAPLIRLEGLALQIVLRMIREAVAGGLFGGGLDVIDQLFRTGHVDLGELGGALWQGVVAGGLMGVAHASLPALLRQGPALTGLASAMESPGWKGISSRFVVGGTVGTTAIATAGWASGNGWDWKHAAETGFGMAFIGTGGEAVTAAGRVFRPLTSHHPPPGTGHTVETSPTIFRHEPGTPNRIAEALNGLDGSGVERPDGGAQTPEVRSLQDATLAAAKPHVAAAATGALASGDSGGTRPRAQEISGVHGPAEPQPEFPIRRGFLAGVRHGLYHAAQLDVVTWNVAGGRRMESLGHFDYSPSEDLPLFAEALRRVRPDIAFLQESHINSVDSFAARLAAETDMPYLLDTRTCPSHIDSEYDLANSILSTRQLTKTAEYRLPHPRFPLRIRGEGDPVAPYDRYLQVAHVNLNGIHVPIGNTHLLPLDFLGHPGGYESGPGVTHASDIEELLLSVFRDQSPLLAGDFNTDDMVTTYPNLMDKLGLSEALTMPATVPWGQHPDHIVFSRAFELVDAAVEITETDHYLCKVTLIYRPWKLLAPRVPYWRGRPS